MSQRSDVHILTKALLEAGATVLQAKMAATLYAINGLDNALAFVAKIPNLTQEVKP